MVLLPIPEEDLSEATLFQGFGRSLITRAGVIMAVLHHLPAHVAELSMDWHQVRRTRAGGYAAHLIMPVELPALEQLVFHPSQYPFQVLLSDAETRDACQDYLRRLAWPALHLAVDVEGPGSLRGVQRVALLEWVESVRQAMERRGRRAWAELTRDMLANPRARTPMTLGVVRRGHNLTVPNEAALEALGLQLRGHEPLIALSEEPYQRAVRASAQLMQGQRRVPWTRAAPPLPRTSLILSAPAVFRWLPRRGPGGAEGRRWALEEGWYRLLRGASTYHNPIQGALLKEGLESTAVQLLITERRRELDLYTACLTTLAANNLAPVLRLPPAVNHVDTDLVSLAGAARAQRSPHRRFKLSKCAGRISDKLAGLCAPYASLLRGSQAHVQIVADTPLELLPVRGLPLSLRHVTSRIPLVPGGMFMAECLTKPELQLGSKDFEEILVVRSFSATDPIRDVLVDHLRECEGAWAGRLRVRVVDVGSAQELADALNSFDGALMVFDGHGRHGRREDVGGLRVGGALVNVWQLYGEVRVPPIVVLSACDTFPLDRSHANTANGFLKLGAVTVLGTLVPIEPLNAAVFVGRLLLRLADFLPALTEQAGVSLRWVDFVARLQRMAFTTDLLLTLAKDGRARALRDWEVYLRLHSRINERINHPTQNPSAWWEDARTYILEATGLTLERFEQVHRRYAWFTESMKYIQIGRPDQLLLLGGEMLRMSQEDLSRRGR